MCLSFIPKHLGIPSSSGLPQRLCKHPTVAAPRFPQPYTTASMVLPVLIKTAASTVLYQATFFSISWLKKIDTLIDFAGTTNFTLIALQSFLPSRRTLRGKIVTGFGISWATRLGGFLLYRILKWGHDKRFDKTRENLGKMAVFWSVQAVWAWVVSLPVTLLNAGGREAGLRGVDFLGWGVFAVGLVMEAVADAQKLAHKTRSENWVDTGLWKYSRHPNYFGEIMVWVGMYLSSVRGLKGWEHAAVVSPLFITGLLLFVSGVPLLEKSADRKHGEKQEYVEYKERTSVVVPCPPGIYRRLPKVVRRTVLLELEMYNNIGKGLGSSSKSS